MAPNFLTMATKRRSWMAIGYKSRSKRNDGIYLGAPWRQAHDPRVMHEPEEGFADTAWSARSLCAPTAQSPMAFVKEWIA